MGTAAHSWVMSFETETEAFSQLQRLLGDRTVQLLDTYDVLEGAREVGRLGGPLWGVRLDSGDFLSSSHDVRRILDAAGLPNAKIMASGDLDETKIAALVAAGAPIDAFGVGTELAVSGDAPSMGAIYKLVEIERRRPDPPHRQTQPGEADSARSQAALPLPRVRPARAARRMRPALRSPAEALHHRGRTGD